VVCQWREYGFAWNGRLNVEVHGRGPNRVTGVNKTDITLGRALRPLDCQAQVGIIDRSNDNKLQSPTHRLRQLATTFAVRFWVSVS
jgi:hypothetical protein